MMVGLVAGLTDLGMVQAFTFCALNFPHEFAAFEAQAHHAGRFSITFRPELN